MDAALVPLLVSGLNLARTVFSHLSVNAARNVVPAPMERVVERETHVIRSERYVEVHRETHTIERLDAQLLREILTTTEQHLNNLLAIQSEILIDALKRERVKDAIGEVQARSKALNNLINAPNLDTDVAYQLTISALMPLEVSLYKARLALEDQGSLDGWRYCSIVGTATLLAGYSFLGLSADHIREQLETEARLVQESLLDDIARRLIAQRRPIPWRDVPALMTLEGADRLRALYDEAVSGEDDDPGFDPGEVTLAELADLLPDIESLAAIDALARAESTGKKRAGALRAIAQHRARLA